MLACVGGIPALAMSGTSWSAIMAKFQNLDLAMVTSWMGVTTPSPGRKSPGKFCHGANVRRHRRRHYRLSLRPDERFQPRLQDLGATYYILESWGNQQQLYRFCCRMAVGANTDYTRYFEAVDAVPLAAMRKVLRETENWKNAAAP